MHLLLLSYCVSEKEKRRFLMDDSQILISQIFPSKFQEESEHSLNITYLSRSWTYNLMNAIRNNAYM